MQVQHADGKAVAYFEECRATAVRLMVRPFAYEWCDGRTPSSVGPQRALL